MERAQARINVELLLYTREYRFTFTNTAETFREDSIVYITIGSYTSRVFFKFNIVYILFDIGIYTFLSIICRSTVSDKRDYRPPVRI